MVGDSQRAVLITGASRGLGRAIALGVASKGFQAWAGVRSQEAVVEIEELARQRKLPLRGLILDVTSEETTTAAFRTIREAGGRLYGVINNAGVTARAFFEDYPEETIRKIFEVNLFGVMRVTRHALPDLRMNGGGRIINISSIGGRIGSNSVTPYIASKFGLEGFSESLAIELRPFDIHVSVVSPGIIKTDIWDETNRILPSARNRESPYYRYFWRMERYAEKLLNSSRLKPTDVADAVCSVLTDPRPHLRYVVGRRAALVAWLRKYTPDRVFEAIYFGQIRRLMEAEQPLDKDLKAGEEQAG
jgi:NAD(P)-dependent dehydrogenase (short-subunit alcohol dehydrogenase family)